MSDSNSSAGIITASPIDQFVLLPYFAVLDMSSHVTLYSAILGVIRSFSLCPALRQLLLKTADHVSSTDDPDSSSILTLLAKMKKCIDTYSSRLE